MIPNPWILLGLLVAWGLSLGVVGYKTYGAGRDAVFAQQALEDKVATVAAGVAASAAAHAISKLKVNHVATRQILEREVVEKAVFRDCASGPDSVRAFNSTIPGYAASEPVGNRQLPAPHPTAQ